MLKYFNTSFSLLLLASFLLSSSVSKISAQTDPVTALSEIREEFSDGMKEGRMVGGAMVIMKSKTTLLETHFGWANLEKRVKADENTIYAWGSITKTLTCIAIMQLQREGMLSIEDAVVKYIPAFSNVENPYNNTERITLKMLMSHTSGLQNSSFITPLSWHKPWPTWEQLEPVFNYIKVELQPGQQYQYSNLGILLLGEIIEIITGDDYEVFVDKNILKPLEMYDSYFDMTPFHLMSGKAQGYYPAEDNKPRKLYHPDIDQGVTTSNGGLKSPIKDFKKYTSFLLGSDDPILSLRYESILPRKTLEMMMSQVKPFRNPETGGIGLGFHIYTDLSKKLIGHTGSANGFISQVMLCPEKNTAYFMACNTSNFRELMRLLKVSIDSKVFAVMN